MTNKKMKEERFNKIAEMIKYFENKKYRAQERMRENKFNETGWYFGLLGHLEEVEEYDFKIGRLQRVEEPPGEVELASALIRKNLFSRIATYSKRFKYELFIREHEGYKDRMFDIAWWVISAIRIKSCVDFIVPAAANCSWSVISGRPNDSVTVKLIEDIPRAVILSNDKKITNDDLKWSDSNFLKFAQLLSDSRFRIAVDAFTTHHQLGNMRMSVAILWSGIEAIFGIQSELRFRLSAEISSFLEPRGRRRLELYKKIKKLYDIRSKVVHGSEVSDNELIEHIKVVRELLSRLLIQFIENEKVPTVDEFEEIIFT